MAGLVNGVFKHKISKYLSNLIEDIELQKGKDSKEYKALYNQYIYTNSEDIKGLQETNLKHYEAIVEDDGRGLPKGIERLYKRQLVIDITMVCAAHCRYCLRANYETAQLRRSEIDDIVDYCSKDENLKEVLITGGDPFMVQRLLKYLISGLVNKAPNIEIIRMGTRVPVQDPERMNEDIYSFFKNYSKLVKFEVAMQVNHVVELQPIVVDVIKNLKESNVTIYAQNVLLKNVNDDIESLISLYDKLRYLGVEAHYLFHSIPMKGTAHFRTSVSRGLELIQELTASGRISGRVKPVYALMTYVGKVVLYDGSILKKDDDGYLHIKTFYRVDERRKWNPTYQLPEDQAYEDENGYIVAKYLDGEDKHISVKLLDEEV